MTRRVVQLVGGPRDGKHSTAIGLGREIRYGEWAGPWEEEPDLDGEWGDLGVGTEYAGKGPRPEP
jgi:hypothetical protein